MSKNNKKNEDSCVTKLYDKCKKFFKDLEEPEIITEEPHQPGFAELSAQLKEKYEAKNKHATEVNKELTHAGVHAILDLCHLGEDSLVSKDICGTIDHLLFD